MLLLLVTLIMLSGILPATVAGGAPVVLEEGMTLPSEPLGLHAEGRAPG